MTVFISLYLRVTKLCCTLSCIKQDAYTFIFYCLSFVCLVVILLILCIFPLRDSATAHSPSCKELNPSFQKDACLCCSLTYKFHFILRHPSLGLSNSSLTLWQRAHPFFHRRIMFLRAHCFLMFSHYLACVLFGCSHTLLIKGTLM